MDESTTPLLVETPAEMSIPDLLVDWARKEPNRTLLETTTDGNVWTPISAAAMHERVSAIAKGLMASGINPGDSVALMSRTSADWTITDFAIWYAGAVTVPVYETSSADQTAWILSDAAVKAVIVEHADHRGVVEEARKEAAAVEHVWTMTDGGLDALAEAGKDVSDEDLRARYDALRTSDLATIIYTSGTTGRPKGAELTHGNFVELSRNGIAALGEKILADGARTLLFMPLAHVFARFVEVLCIAAGAPAGHTADTTQLMRDIAGFRPTFILSVPRVFEKVYNASEQKAAAGGKEKIFRWAAGAAQAYSEALDTGKVPFGVRMKHKVAHKLVLHKIQDALGGQAEYAISGGAPLGPRLAHFFRGVGLTVLEGYGLTETTAPVSVGLPERTKIGTVGKALPGVSLRIAEDGEILTKGIANFVGYHNNDEANAEAISDGWFHTGDLGALDSEGYLTITGRKKEIIVTASGKNVVPSQLEDSLRAHPLISQCVVVGDQKPFVAALITLDAEMLPTWLANNDLPEMDVTAAAQHPKVREALQRAVDGTNAKVSRAESIRRFEILTDDFTVENEYLTPSMKVKRAAVLNDYAAEVEDLYAKARAEREAM
ncbi:MULTISPECIES: AMP-dependent synthetase/ligase [unclassified Pseudactinotalea]|uniref:AMP-dependent synthetase/ligase n=1 Tax=Micrococcales TaxID=85006 RepID=UPI003C7C0D90